MGVYFRSHDVACLSRTLARSLRSFGVGLYSSECVPRKAAAQVLQVISNNGNIKRAERSSGGMLHTSVRAFALSRRGSAYPSPSVLQPDSNKPMPKIHSPNAATSTFSFSASGWLIAFHFGVIHGLEKPLKVIIHIVTSRYDDHGSVHEIFLPATGRLSRQSYLVGASGGGIASASYMAGVSPAALLDFAKRLSSHTRQHGLWWRVHDPLKALLTASLPEDAAEKCNGRVALAMTRVWPKPQSAAELFTHFTSKTDLVQAMVTSSYVPCYTAPSPVVRFRGGLYTDGAIASVIPKHPEAINVCVFPSAIVPFGRCPDYHIGPDMQLAALGVCVKQLDKWTLNPPDDKGNDYLYGLGLRAAETFVEQEVQLQASQMAPQGVLPVNLLTVPA